MECLGGDGCWAKADVGLEEKVNYRWRVTDGFVPDV